MRPAAMEALSLFGTGIMPVTSAFLGWFGPRGLASILFVLLICEENRPMSDEPFVPPPISR